MATHIKKMIQEHHIEFVDLRFTDLRGKEQHLTLPKNKIDDHFFQHGKAFDGSSIAGWADINKSDLILMADEKTPILDPFTEIPTLLLRCDVWDPLNHKTYPKDPRSIAKRAETYLKKSGIADVCYIGGEVEFFIFDDVRFHVAMNSAFYSVDSKEASWNSGTIYEEGNLGHRTRIKGGYFPVPPVDAGHDLRSFMCRTLFNMGLSPEVHHHEVATSNQNEITTGYNHLLQKADDMMILKYTLHNAAQTFGKTVTFMPKPIVGDNGSGLHCHISLAQQEKNLFPGDYYAGLSELALFFIGGILKHARALNALTNASTNSYKRLVPGFEAPVTLIYSENNRSAAIRIPHVFTEQEKRIEVRFPDSTGNPYLAFSALLMAGLDGIQNKIHPKEACDENLFHLSKKRMQEFGVVCSSLEEALKALEEDHAFLLEGNVFNEDILKAYLALKYEEVSYLNRTTHPIEFDLYYSL